jgi:hypothetical protein
MREQCEEHFKFMEAVRKNPEAIKIQDKQYEIRCKVNKLYFKEHDKSYEHTNLTRRQIYGESLMLDCEYTKLEFQILNVVFPDPTQLVDKKKELKKKLNGLKKSRRI